MNYDHCNQVHEFWRKKIFPHLVHVHTSTSFDDYLRKFSFLPSGKWIKDLEKLKLTRVPFAVDPEALVKKYKDACVTYNAPLKAEDGVQRVIYQISPTLHLEAAFWVWIENKILQSYASILICYHEEEEYLKFVDEMWTIRREGNTEDKPTLPGFRHSPDIIDIGAFTKNKEGLDKSVE